MAFTFDFDFFSDLHKDVYGFRPRQWNEFYLPETTDARRQEIFDDLVEYSKVVFERERQEKARQVAEFEKAISQIQNVVGCCREQAIFHYVESLRPSVSDLRDPGYICWLNDLPYQLESVIAPACKELLAVMESIDA